ncbi:unnamed protein product [Brassica rapa subsp. narinosa]
MMDSDIQISSGSSSSSSSNCSGSGSDDELIGKETSGSSSFTSSAGNSQDSAGCTNHASPSGNGVRILPPSSMTHGTSASPLHGPSDPVDMTGNEIGEDKNSERLIYQDALQNLNQPRTEVDLPPGTLSTSGNIICFFKIALAWMLRKETTCLNCSGGILAADQGLGKTVSMIALILKQKYESQLKSEITSKQESEILDLDADDDESENAKHDENMENAKDEEARELNSNKRPAAGTLVVCPASVVTQWVRELDEKVSDESKLSVLVYHGGNRTKDPSVLAKYDVVITTYAIVTNEVPKQFLLDEDEDENDDSHSFSNSKKRKVSVSASKNRGSFGGTLSRVGWLRVVLDEAQTIKNHRIQVARACRILRAKRRWCLSGAPIQNTVDDLYSYFRFLRYNPYDVYKSFYLGIKAPIIRNEKHAELDATLENLRDEVNKIGVVERSMEDLKESVMEIRNRMSVMERLEKRLDETEETRKREFATLFQATLQSHMEEEISPPIRRSGKQIASEEEGSGLFRGGTSGVRSESVTRVGEVRREVECEERNRSYKAEGLCFQCGEKSHARRDCPNKELMVLVVQEDEGEEAEQFEEDEKDEEEAVEFAECAALSTKSAMGISSPKTIKLRGSVGEAEAVVLIDSGATHNFIDCRLMQKLGLVAEETQSYGVITGSGKPVRGGGICRNVTLTMQGYSITSDFLPLELNNVDIILGIQWLETLGETRVNWKLQTLKIPVEGRLVSLQGEEKRRMVASAYGEDHGGSSATRLTVDDLKYLFMVLWLTFLDQEETSFVIEFLYYGSPRTSCFVFVRLETSLAFSIDAPDWWTHGEGANPMMFTKKLMFLRGEVILWSSLKSYLKPKFTLCSTGLIMDMKRIHKGSGKGNFFFSSGNLIIIF